jgi:Tfp pilus assembly major pilin PilA
MKVANSYASLLGGVSQQATSSRFEGQHTEQVNMLSDPVEGLSRRHGSTLQAESLTAYPVAQFAAYTADTATWRTLDFSTGGKQYALLYRTRARPVTANPLPPLLVYNRTDKVFMTTVRNATDAVLDTFETGGAAGAVQVGKYVFMAGNSLTVNGTATQKWNTPANLAKAVVWVRGGAYSRTFKVIVRSASATLATVSYTTPAASYQGTLNTSDIPSTATDYTKQVNDRVNAYNSAVTSWIGTSSAAVQPAAIAEQLRVLLVAAGVACTRQGSHVVFNTSANVVSLEVDDGGDGSLIRGVADEIESIEKVSVIHYPGKVVKVRGKNSAEAYYLKAVPKSALAPTTDYVEVTWVEGAGVENAINSGLIYGIASGTNFYVASSATLLSALIAGDHPTFEPSAAGDDDSAPAPYFINRKITYLGMFQSRLLVGSGGVLCVSRSGDYFNFFRSTVLTTPADDPFEMLAQGSEDDTLRFSTMYDQNLVIFGNKRQYIIDGRSALTPTSANMPVMSNYEDVTDAPPVGAGGYIMYAKTTEGSTSIHQIQPGQTQNSPESYSASSQLNHYINGTLVEALSSTGTPSHLLVRTDSERNSMYLFSYLDRVDGRKMDSWSTIKFNSVLGVIVGASVVPGGFNVYYLRTRGTSVFLVADFVSLRTGMANTPYLDSQRSWTSVSSGIGTVVAASGAEFSVAYTTASEKRFGGVALQHASELTSDPVGLVAGANQDAFFTPTNPFMRDGKGKAILSGSLTIGKLLFSVANSGGITWRVTSGTTERSVGSFNGRILGDPGNIIGIEPIVTTQVPVTVGLETRDYAITVKARKWMPLMVTALEWSGQFFNRVQRF